MEGWQLILIIFLGLVGVAPMVLYDFLLHRIIEKEEKPFYIFETSWLVNTLNNLIGFGGIFSFGLRSNFYSDESDKTKILHAISKIFFFTMSGLSIYSLMSLIYLFLYERNSVISEYFLWIIAGALYFPIVLLVTAHKKTGVLGGLTAKMRFSLLGTSFLEWTGAMMSFLLIGPILSIHIPYIEVAALFIAAMVIGILSMIPGSLGSFDVVMIYGLVSLGLELDVAVGWLLLYRMTYYFIPFILGILFSVKNLGGKFNENYNGVPTALLKQVLNHATSFLLYISGILLVLSATVPEAFKQLRWLKEISPWSEKLVSEFPKLLLGFLFILMGRSISNKIKRAYVPSIVVEGITLIYVILTDFSLTTVFFVILLIIMTIFTKNELYREQLVFSIETFLKDGVIFVLLVILYSAIGVYNSPLQHHSHFNRFLLFPNERLWFTGFLAVFFVSLFGIVFINYLKGKKVQIGVPLDEERVEHILETYGGNSESHLVFLKDKRVYFYQNKKGEDTVYLQFQAFRDKLVVMGDPVGKDEDFNDCLTQFVTESDLYGYEPIFYEVHKAQTLFLHELGFRFIKMGEEAKVFLPEFTISGKKHRGNRAIVNRMEREGFHMEVLSPPFSNEIMRQLKTISDDWLGDRKEKGFSLGFYSESYIQKAPVAVVKTSDHHIVAFATIMPSHTEDVVTVDLMRFSSIAPTGVMDYLFIRLFEYYRDQGIEFFDLGMAPLSNVGASRKSFLQERLAYLVFHFGTRFYSFQGLRNYKEKYATEWTSRYTLYPRDNSILFVIYALLVVDNRSANLGNSEESNPFDFN
jgi:phosphatidylglycerol lysyltransferase